MTKTTSTPILLSKPKLFQTEPDRPRNIQSDRRALLQPVISNSVATQQNKNDYAELNYVKYGLLNVDEWQRQIPPWQLII